MTQNYIHEIGQVEKIPPPEPSPEDGEVPGTGDHNDYNEDSALNLFFYDNYSLNSVLYLGKVRIIISFDYD